MLLASVSPMLSWMSATPPPTMRSLRQHEPLRTVSMNVHAADLDLVHHSHETHEVRDRIIKLTKAMRASELREGAASVVAEMEAIDLRAVVREAESSSKRDQQALASAMAENARLSHVLAKSLTSRRSSTSTTATARPHSTEKSARAARASQQRPHQARAHR